VDPARIVQSLNEHDRIPVEAIHAADADRPAAVAAFLHAIDLHLSPGGTPVPVDALFFMFHLLGEWREKSAYRPLARLLRRPPDEIESIFGTSETLHRVMAAVFDGDPEPLYEIIRDRTARDIVRLGMCEAIAMVTLRGELPRTEAERFLFACYSELEPQHGDAVWVGWQSAISLLGLAELKPMVEQAFARELIEGFWLEFKDFEQDLRESIDDPTGSPGAGRGNYTLFGKTIEEFSDWYCFSPQARADREERAARRELAATSYAPVTPVTNPWGKVGRNDPCPCGSTKKFKKCCLKPGIGPAAAATQDARSF
jgi:Protein of unknown function (DUF1186)/SEC-C motif